MASRPDRTPLIKYLKVQERWEKDTFELFKRASSTIDYDIKRIAGRDNVGDVMRRSQLMEAKRAMNLQIGDLWTKMGGTVKAGQAQAAAAAIDSVVDYQGILRNVPGITSDQITALTRAHHQQAINNMGSALRRMQGTSYVPLSKQVYKTEKLVTGYVDRIVENALAKGFTARELAAQVKPFIRPDVPGGASYAAMRLGRTEINNAFHATQVMEGIQNPYITAMRWNTSGSHPNEDECDEYAEAVNFEGGSPGLWLPEQMPRKPHPHCLCYTTAEMMDEDLFVDSLVNKLGGGNREAIKVRSGVEDLRDSWNRGEGYVKEKALRDGYSNLGLEIGKTGDGRKILKKKVATATEGDKEYISGKMANAFGIDDIHTIKSGPSELVSDYIDGQTGSDYRRMMVDNAPIDQFDYNVVSKYTDEIEERMMTMKNGKEIGLLDILTQNTDRHSGNWIIKGDAVVPIDHGMTHFGDYFSKRPTFGPFAKKWFVPQTDRVREELIGWKPLVPKAELIKHRKTLEGMKRDFGSHEDWYENVMSKMDELIEAAE